MKALSWLRARPKTLASAAGVTAGVIAITTLAFTYEGNPTTKVDLNDGGVWITKSSSLMVGHFNYESTVLDGGLRTTGENFDILQDSSNVLVVDGGNSSLTVVDPARVSLADTTTIPGSAKVALGAETAAILDSASGNLWVQPVDGLAGFEVQGTEPLVELGEGSDVTVAQDGTVFAVSGERGEVVTVRVDDQGEALEPSTASLGELSADSAPSITAVGATPVVLSPADGVVMTPGGFRTEIEGADTAVLQQASATTDAVTVATRSHLVQVPLNGGEVVQTSSGGQGAPAAPVSLLGCSYGAWAGSSKFIRECPGDASDVLEDIPGAENSTKLAFRVNRDVIVLNDVVGGAAWLADESLQQVDNWNDLTPPDGETENEEESTEETVETTLPERDAENTPPVAEDDSFGVRPGQTTLLPVLDNDNDADGDVLVAALAEKQPGIGDVQPIYDGGSLQIAVDEDASGSASFSYEANDGRGGKDTASVALTIHDWDTNTAPKPKRVTTLAVESGGTISYNVLPDWIDPEGDDIYLKNVVAAPGDEVEFSTDGQITYRAVASLQGRKEVQIAVADGLGETATGTLHLDVRPAGSTLPKTNADHVVTNVGQQVTVSPLANDTSSGREPLRLTRVEQEGGTSATITPDFTNKTFTFSAPQAGVYYVKYLVAAGPNAVPGLVRVDVQDATETDLPPVAVRDVALLPTGGEVLLGVLNNDTDPSGGILVIQSVTVEPGSGISVSVLNHETLRIGDQGALDEQVRITYRISNGSKTAEGEVIVIPIPAPDKLLPPVANDDQVVVRAGDVVTIPVLDNDSHPNGDVMHVAPDLIEPFVDPEDGEIFVSQDTVRFKAGDEAKTVYATYEVVDSHAQKDAGYITIQILPVDEEKNSAPRPRDITVRALSGSSINIAVPLDGIDADGDSVELLGIDSRPAKGRIVEVAQNYLVYEAFADATGVDTFTYRVRDRLGKEGVATINVGVAPGEDINQAPYAVKDAVVVRPGREVAVPVMANDSDPEGDVIALVEDGLSVPDVDGLKARVSGDRVVVDAPDRALETSVQYAIRDSRGAEATAVLQITVDEDVPLLSPIARDDRVLATDIVDGELDVDVDALSNDEDPDGTTDALTVDVGAGGTLLEDGKIRVTIGERMQLVRYTITDVDEQATSAFIFVPAISDLRPALNSTKPVEVVSGETKVLPLDEYVTVAGGGSVIITEKDKVGASHSDGSDLLQDERTLVYTSAPGYFGEDGLTFEVTDGTGPDDPDGRKATLTIPITVLPPDNQQPSFTQGEMNVAPGEEATSLDLQALTTDPDPEDTEHEFQLIGGAGDGLTARVEGSTLRVEAASDVRKGTAATLTVRVSDGETEPIEGAVTVRVTASTRDMAAANTDTISEADQGKPIRVPALANDVNPFPDTPLKIVSAVPESGQGTAEIDGDQVVVTPDAEFVGVLVVRYRIQDATKDADREVDGKIVVTVQGVPDAPGRPMVTSVQDRSVVVSFTPPSNNGAEITHYTVTSVSGNPYSKQCDSTTCTLDGLTNNVEYTFEVTATNRVGESEPSSASEMARPDARPDTPNAPTLKFGDKSLAVAWATPTTPGSPVESFTLEISPAPPSGMAQKTGVKGNSLTWEGLENGTNYQVRVQAHNRAPEPSSWSSWSIPEIPAGPPSAPAAPTTQELSPVGSQAQMAVNWQPPAANGDAISGYQLRVIRGGETIDTLPVSAGARSQAVTVNTSEEGYTYSIRAQNKAGWGEWSAPSAERRGVVRPDAPNKPAVTVGDRKLTVTPSSYQLSADQRNGARASEITYQFRINNGGWQSNWDGTNIGGLTNGQDYTVQIRAVANVGGTTYAGAESASSNTVRPFGAPHAPTGSAVNAGQSVTLSWNATGSANGRPVTTYISVNGGGWSQVATSGSTSRGNGYDQTYSIRVRVVASEGGSAESGTYSAKTDSPPQPSAWVTRGPVKPGCTGPSGNACYVAVLNTANFAGGAYQIRCTVDGQIFGDNDGHAVQIPSNGSVQLLCWSGRLGQKGVTIIGGTPSSAQTAYF